MTTKLFLAAALAGAFVTSAASAQHRAAGGDIDQNLGKMDYGVCRGTDPKCYHDWVRPKTTQYRVLLYTMTGASRHANLGPLLGPGMNPPLTDANVAQKGMLQLATDNGWQLDYTEDVRQLANLSGYNAVVFYSTSREILDDTAKTALRQYIRAGGGFVGIHNAFGTLYNWPYYEGLLGGANFYTHDPARDGDVVVVDSKDASTKDLPRRWRLKDEWYNLVPFPTNVRFLATVDEKSWPVTPPRPANAGNPPPADNGAVVPPQSRYPSVIGKHPGHGDFHPVAWCQYYDGGKAWLTTLGHDAKLFNDPAFPGAREFKTMLTGGLKSVMGIEPFCQ